MKKTLLIALSGLMLTGAMTSCKKGENDPFLSLKSRKARVAGEWTVTKSENYDKIVNGSVTQTNTATYDGTTETNVEVTSSGGGSVSETTTSTYTVKYVFEKDGTYTQTQSSAGGTTVVSGNWLFLGKNKDTELKNKEAIMLTILKTVVTPTGGDAETTTETGYNTNMVLTIDQLKSKEMVVKYADSWVDGEDSGETTSTTTLTLD